MTVVSQLLVDWHGGDSAALDRLIPLVYDDLHRIASRQFAGERAGHTLQPTGLVHEAYLRLAGHDHLRCQDRAHFLAIAATTMRRLLVSHARRHRSAKRGGGATLVALREEMEAVERCADLVALDEALAALAEIDPRQSRIVELRYFGGLTVEETAAVLQVSAATVKLDWSLARAWLFRELSGR